MPERRSPVSPRPGLAKTSHPRLARVLARERLFELLDRSRRSSGVWINAGAGCGKTTLVASYLTERGLDSRWYQIDVHDSDVATFFHYLSLDPGRDSTRTLPLFASEHREALSAFTRRYFRAFFGEHAESFVLVLDDYHELAPQSPLHRVVEIAISEAPPESCVMVLSRGEPPPSMARLRVNREIEVVGWDELRLTREESDAIVDQWDDACAEFARERLYEKTQGWVAGLILMLDQVVCEGRVADVPDLSSRQLVFDYLAGEVLRGFDSSTRALLLKTAFLTETSPSMASDLASEPRAGEILDRLHRGQHLIGLRPGGQEPMYRFHPLLADMLRARAEVELEEHARRTLLSRARVLLESAGAHDELAELLRRDEDWSALVRLILARAPHMAREGREEALERWLASLPCEVVAENAWVHYWRATCCAGRSPREGRRLFERAFALFRQSAQPDHDALLLTCSGAMETIICDLDDFVRLDFWIEAAIGLLEEDVPRSPEAEARATVSAFLSLVLRQPFHSALQSWSVRARRRMHAIEEPGVLARARWLLATALIYTGEFLRAHEVIRAMRRVGRTPLASPVPIRTLHYVESTYHMFIGDRDSCLAAVNDGLELERASGETRWTLHLLVNGAAGALGAGDLDVARDFLSRIHKHLDSMRPLERAMFHFCSAWLHLLGGDPVAAFHNQKIALGLAVECGCPLHEVVSRVAIAQLLSDLGDDERAITQLLRARSLVRLIRNRWLDFYELMIFAYVALSHGHRRQGLAALRRALRIGRENDYTHFLGWRPVTVSKLCAWALDESIEVDYVSRLVRTRSLVPEGDARRSPSWPWRFRIQTFGDFELLRDGSTLGMQTRLQRKPLDLLKALIGFGARNVSESRLAGSLWPRIDADYAYGSLTTTLHRLRKVMGEDRLISLRYGHLSIDSCRCWLDLRAFEAVTVAIDKGRRLALPGELEDQLEGWTEELFSLYRGPFMGSEGNNPRFLLLRGRLRNSFLRSVGDLARHFESHGQWERAADCYERGIDADQLAEGLYRRLMLCYRELGRFVQAIDIYDRLRSTLAAERTGKPAPETRLIYRRLVECL